jgi:hypothetical protein
MRIPARSSLCRAALSICYTRRSRRRRRHCLMSMAETLRGAGSAAFAQSIRCASKLYYPGGASMSKPGFDHDVDDLFQLPLSEFTSARNALVSRLNKGGRGYKAEKLRAALVKPSISAWAVNQVYWKHREAFDDLIAAGQQLIQAQKSQFRGKAAGLQQAQARWREALSGASRLAEALLRDAGHNSTLDLMRRVNSTLEALSTYSPGPDTPRLGRLTADVSPAGFDSIASLIPSGGPVKAPTASTRVVPFKSSLKKVARAKDEKDDASGASANEARRTAEQRLHDARMVAAHLAAAQKKAAADVAEAVKNRLEAEVHLENAKAAEQGARRRLDSVAGEAEKAARALEEAQRICKGLKR